MNTAFSKQDTLAMKGIAIILMLFHHTFNGAAMYKGYEMSFWPMTQSSVHLLAWFGKECVSVFAFLSAYGLTVSLRKSKKPLKQWLTERYFALFKGYWFVYLLSLPVTALLDQRYKTYTARGEHLSGFFYALLDFLGVGNIFGTPSLNGAWWYMSLALMILFIVPATLAMFDRVGWVFTILLGVLIPRILNNTFPGNNAVMSYLLIVLCGACFADYQVFEKLSLKGRPLWLQTAGTVLSTALLALAIRTYQKMNVESSWELNYGVIAVILIVWCFETLLRIPKFREVLIFLGRHSMNIFLTHIFLRSFYAVKFIYSLGNCFLTVGMLLLLSLLLSLVIEGVKQLIGFDRFYAWLTGPLMRLVAADNFLYNRREDGSTGPGPAEPEQGTGSGQAEAFEQRTVSEQ